MAQHPVPRQETVVVVQKEGSAYAVTMWRCDLAGRSDSLGPQSGAKTARASKTENELAVTAGGRLRASPGFLLGRPAPDHGVQDAVLGEDGTLAPQTGLRSHRSQLSPSSPHILRIHRLPDSESYAPIPEFRRFVSRKVS